MNKLLDLMASRRDVRGNDFLAKEIIEEDLSLIFKAALTAPSVGYSQPWEFVLIKDKNTKIDIHKNFTKENNKAKEIFKDRNIYQDLKLDGIIEAPINIAVLYNEKEEPTLGQTSMSKMGEYSVVCAIQNMWLMARSLDIGLGWVSILNEKDVLSTLNIPQDRKLIAYLCLGYVKEFKNEPELKTMNWEEEKTLENILHVEKFKNKEENNGL